jgi:hypothetical protein
MFTQLGTVVMSLAVATAAPVKATPGLVPAADRDVVFRTQRSTPQDGGDASPAHRYRGAVWSAHARSNHVAIDRLYPSGIRSSDTS